MFRSLSGFKATYKDLRLMVVSEFDEWRVAVFSPHVVLQGQRQFTAPKAKDHALMLAKTYLTDIRHETLGDEKDPDWEATGPEDWLLWKV
ncbi:MAG: hypothetical protein ACE141_02775 [Bryobacteraceae bacterium]